MARTFEELGNSVVRELHPYLNNDRIEDFLKQMCNAGAELEKRAKALEEKSSKS